MDHVGEDVLHRSLIGRAGVLQSKRHDGVAIYSNRCVEGSFFFIFGSHLDLVVTAEAVHERKHFMANYIVEEDIGDRQRKGIFWASFAQISEIHTYANLAILFLDWHNVCQRGGIFNFLNKICFLQLVNLRGYLIFIK